MTDYYERKAQELHKRDMALIKTIALVALALFFLQPADCLLPATCLVVLAVSRSSGLPARRCRADRGQAPEGGTEMTGQKSLIIEKAKESFGARLGQMTLLLPSVIFLNWASGGGLWGALISPTPTAAQLCSAAFFGAWIAIN